MDPLIAQSLRTIQAGSKSFALAARLFDRRTREGALLLYAWCRHCDDEIDQQVLGFRGEPTGRTTRDRLAALRSETLHVIAGGASSEPAFAALQEVMRRHAIPTQHPLDLLDGFAMDVADRRYETLDDCCHYCYHVAGVVGVMMAHVMGVEDQETLDRAADLGIAFQMTNIARDVVDDAAVGRVYLPEVWLREAGVPRDEVGRADRRASVWVVATRLLAEAERYYASAHTGLARLPFRSAWAVAAARRVYRDIGRLVKARGEQAWDRRAGTGRIRKMALAAAAFVDALRATGRAETEPGTPRTGLWTRPRPGAR